MRVGIAGLIARAASERCSDWDSVQNDFEAIVAACVLSRRLRVDSSDDFGSWLAPDPSEWNTPLRQAGKRLARRREVWDSGRVPFIDPLLDSKRLAKPHAFLRLGDSLFPSDVLSAHAAFVRAVTADEAEGLEPEIEAFIERHAEI